MKFSVIIALAPDRNAEALISLEKVDYDKNNFEIIVEKGLNPSDNRNRGINKAKGEIIAFIDDDAIVPANLLEKAETFLEGNNEIDIVGGPQLTPNDEKGFAKFSGYALSSKFGAWKVSNRYAGKKTILDADETMLTSADLFCRKKVFKKVKFNPMLFPGEDPDFIAKAKKEGFKIAYSPEIIVYHRRRRNLWSFANQIYRYGKTRPKKEKFTETLLKRPFFLIPALFVIYLLIILSIIIINPLTTDSIIKMGSYKRLSIYILFLPLTVYILLNLSFSLYESLKNKNYKAFFVLPLIYLIIHFSYGVGMIYGYIKKLKE